MHSISRIGERTLSTNTPAAIVLSRRSYYASSNYRCRRAPVGVSLLRGEPQDGAQRHKLRAPAEDTEPVLI